MYKLQMYHNYVPCLCCGITSIVTEAICSLCLYIVDRSEYHKTSLVPRCPSFILHVAAEKAEKPGDEAITKLCVRVATHQG